jgi:4-amino-4-deoxy-L-arabinose transferase-like glycosyltransferase
MSERWRQLRTPAIALLALVSSAAGVVNAFTYDDRYIIQLNPAMKTLRRWWTVFAMSYWPHDWGGDGYRPLTMLAFKLEFALGAGRPVIFHAVNILLYVAVALLVYRVARCLLPEWAAWLAAALFAVHPVHVEAVANVVGQSELLAALAVLAALLLYLRARLNGVLPARTIAAVCVLYAIACFSKEHGIVLPALLAAAELTVIRDVAPARDRIRRLRPFYLTLALIAVCFLAVRSIVLSDHGIGGFEPFTPFSALHIGARDRILTALGVVPQWIRLFYWPVRLSSEYGPPDIPIAQGFEIWQLPGFLLLAAVLAIGVVLRRRQPVISFGIAFVCCTLLPSSNFVVPAGIVLAERTLFLPSVGAMLVAAAAAVIVAKRLNAREWQRAMRRAAVGLCALFLAAGTIKSFNRTRIWRDNATLFHNAIAEAPLAYRAHFILGSYELDHGQVAAGEAEFRRGLALFPYDPSLSYALAERYRADGMCKPAIPLYKWTYEIDPQYSFGRGMYAWCLLSEARFDEARDMAFASIRVGGSVPSMRRIIAVVDSVKAAAARGALRGAGRAQGNPSKLPEPMQKTRLRGVTYVAP